MNKIRARLDALPNKECKWKMTDDFIMDARDRIVAKSANPRVREFLANAPEDVARLLAEIERLEQAVINNQYAARLEAETAEQLEAQAAAMREALGKIKRGQKNVSPNRSYGGTKWIRLTKGELQGIARDALSVGGAGRALLAEVMAMRVALEEIKEEAEGDFDRDIILTACKSGLRGGVAREE